MMCVTSVISPYRRFAAETDREPAMTCSSLTSYCKMTHIVILILHHIFTATKQSAPLPAAHKTAANEQRTYANSLAISHKQKNSIFGKQ